MSNKRLKAIKAALKARGNSPIGPKGIEAIKAETGSNRGVKEAARELGIEIRSPGGTPDEGATVPKYRFTGTEGRLSLPEFELAGAAALADIVGGYDVKVGKINREGLVQSTEISAAADRYAAEQESEARKYVVDRELEAALGVANIKAKGEVDLQQIVNAGNREVENIRGEFGLKGKQIDRSTAILGGLVNAFNFS